LLQIVLMKRLITRLTQTNLSKPIHNSFGNQLIDTETEKVRLFSGLKIIACLATIVCFSINMAKVGVTRKACVMHVIESITGNEPKAF
jgi:hypothetical protein